MTQAFSPSAFLFCDFASEDTEGRATIAGIHPGLGNYRSVRYFPRFVAAIVRPLVQKSDLHMRVEGPSGAMNLRAGFEGDTEPQVLDRLTFIIPLHRLGPAPGHYRISLGDKEDTLEVVCEFDLATLPKSEVSPPVSAGDAKAAKPRRPKKRASI